ncbi:hypothetical protein [Actinomadura sp. GTD37]|uniref:hypothetical protein n=1 Tax=Actinomadura sp. GTD37 TaxID=1778030 RepID=UPI0035C21CF6
MRAQRKPATVRMARWSAAHPWSAVAMWVLFVVLSLGLGTAAGTDSISDAESGVGESGRAGRIAASGDFPEKPEENVLITATGGGRLDLGAAKDAAADVVRRMKALPTGHRRGLSGGSVRSLGKVGAGHRGRAPPPARCPAV